MGLFSFAWRAETEAAEKACSSVTTALKQCRAANGKEMEAACNGLQGQAAYCIGMKVSACQKRSEAYEKCFIQAGNSFKFKGSCIKEQKKLIGCLRWRARVSKETGL